MRNLGCGHNGSLRRASGGTGPVGRRLPGAEGEHGGGFIDGSLPGPSKPDADTRRCGSQRCERDGADVRLALGAGPGNPLIGPLFGDFCVEFPFGSADVHDPMVRPVPCVTVSTPDTKWGRTRTGSIGHRPRVPGPRRQWFPRLFACSPLPRRQHPLYDRHRIATCAACPKQTWVAPTCRYGLCWYCPGSEQADVFRLRTLGSWTDHVRLGPLEHLAEYLAILNSTHNSQVFWLINLPNSGHHLMTGRQLLMDCLYSRQAG